MRCSAAPLHTTCDCKQLEWKSEEQCIVIRYHVTRVVVFKLAGTAALWRDAVVVTEASAHQVLQSRVPMFTVQTRKPKGNSKQATNCESGQHPSEQWHSITCSCHTQHTHTTEMGTDITKTMLC